VGEGVAKVRIKEEESLANPRKEKAEMPEGLQVRKRRKERWSTQQKLYAYSIRGKTRSY